MNMLDRIGSFLNSISEAVSRVFSPLEHHYPATGVLPFDGDIRPTSDSDE